MKFGNLLSSLLLLMALSIFAFVSCVDDESSVISNSIDQAESGEDLRVYVIIDGKRVVSDKYRLLTDEELKVLHEKGWLGSSSSNEVTLRAADCQWADESRTLDCSDGDYCGVVQAPQSQVCLACFDDGGNLIRSDYCREEPTAGTGG